MVELYTFLRKRVKLLADNGKTYIGEVIDYLRAGEDEPDDEEAIILKFDCLKHLIQFNISEIVSIEVADDHEMDHC